MLYAKLNCGKIHLIVLNSYELDHRFTERVVGSRSSKTYAKHLCRRPIYRSTSEGKYLSPAKGSIHVCVLTCLLLIAHATNE